MCKQAKACWTSQDLNHIQVRAYFDEPEIGELQSGQAVKIVWDAKPNRVWHGHIDRAPTTVTQYGNRNVGECVITVDDARGICCQIQMWD